MACIWHCCTAVITSSAWEGARSGNYFDVGHTSVGAGDAELRRRDAAAATAGAEPGSDSYWQHFERFPFNPLTQVRPVRVGH